MKQVSCPKCRAQNSLSLAASVFFVCKNCKTGVDLEKQQPTTATHGLGSINPSGLPLGKSVTLLNKKLAAIGRVQYQGQDDEDVWTWEEILLSDGQAEYWLEFEPELARFSLFESVPLSSNPPKGTVLDESETGTLISVEGELPWVPDPNERITYTTYQISPSELYSTEHDGETEEHFRGTIIPSEQVYAAFGVSASAKKPSHTGSHALVQPTHSWIIVGSVLVVLSGLIAPLFEQKKFATTFTLCPAGISRQSACIGPESLIGPIPLTPRFKTYGLRVSSATTTAGELKLTLIDRDKRVTLTDRPVYRPIPSTTTLAKTSHGERNFRLTHAADYYLDIQSFTGMEGSTITVELIEKPLGIFFSWILNAASSFFFV